MNAWDRYWHGFALERPRIVVLRVLFFALLGLDLWLINIEHAPRYGAGDFNVTQIDFLDRLVPTPTAAVTGALWLIGGFLALRAAFGVAVRQSAIGLVVCYAALYFWSQADSYQHHYLISLLLIIMAFIPEWVWHGVDAPAPPADAVEQPPDRPPAYRHWALRLIYVQLALLYFWTAVAKVDDVWLAGITMDQLTTSAEVRALMAGLAERLGTEPAAIYPLAAKAVMLGEFFAAAVFLWRPLWGIGLLIVPFFHVGVEILEFDIEWFSYYMIVLDLVLLAPPRLVALLHRAGTRAAAPLRGAWAALTAPRPRGSDLTMAYAGVVAVITALVAAQVPIEGATLTATGVGVTALLGGWPWPRPVERPQLRAAVQVLCAGAMIVTLASSTVPYDYYRLWGGDLTRRGHHEASVEMYEKANAVAPPGPARELKLGQVLQRLGRRDEAVLAYRRAVARVEAVIPAAQRAVHRNAGDAKARFALADLQFELLRRCQTLARVTTGDERAQAEDCARAARLASEENWTRGLELAPRDREGLRGLNSLRRLKP
ncbi:MAG: HTTM domain-containing protein [Myxococcales bacterium]|nr:HTTM domain-containing protein [Myxococcales bacterium]